MVSVGSHEELGSLSFGGQGVQCSGADVEIRVGGRENEEENSSVDDIG